MEVKTIDRRLWALKAVFVLRDAITERQTDLHGVTESQNFQEPPHRASESVRRLSRADQVAALVVEEDAVDGALAEEHQVLRQGPGLVGKQELDVAELLVQVARVALGRLQRVGQSVQSFNSLSEGRVGRGG